MSNVKDKKILITGGGVGNAPLYYLAKKLKEHNNSTTFLYCARSKNYIYLQDRFKKVCDEFMIATDDGSEGIKGNGVDLSKQLLKDNSFDMIMIYYFSHIILNSKLINV